VTIGAGLICSDGIVLAADGEVTHGYVKSAKVNFLIAQRFPQTYQ
jgi:hypothetical protein